MNKKNEHGIVTKNKARLVAQGYSKEEGIDYDETFAPVARMEAIRIFLAFATYMNFIVFQMDVKSATRNGKLKEEVYVKQPLGFKSSEFPDYVYKLDKALYGLKQAAKACSSVKTPMVPPNNLGPDLAGKPVNETLYRGMIGSLMYLSATRPDIQFSTVLYARYQSNPKESHLIAVKRILRYLKGTPTLGLYYPKCSGFDLKGYSDSNYVGCNMDRKSTTGACQILSGKLVCWSAKKQQSVAMYSAEPEYVVAAGCCANILWMKSQLSDYDIHYKMVPIFCDNISAIAISNNLVLHSRTKHTDIRYWNGYLRKGRKTKPKRQNRTRNGKDCERQSQTEAKKSIKSKSQQKSPTCSKVQVNPEAKSRNMSLGDKMIRVDDDLYNLSIVEAEFPAKSLKMQLYLRMNFNANLKKVGLRDMALPPHEQILRFLRYEGLEFPDTDIADFKGRLARIHMKEVNRVPVFDFRGFPDLMAKGVSGRMLMEHRDEAGVSVFTSRSWRRMLDIRGPLVHELILEFFSTFRFGQAILDLDTLGTLQDPILRLCHRLIACSIVGRSQAPEKVTVMDLFYLRGMDVGSVNVPYLLARYLRLFAARRKSGAHIYGGQFVARLAEHFGLLTAEILGGLTVAMGPERQPDAAAGAPDNGEDAPIVNEGGQADPAPEQAPQQPPPPPPAHARTMP
ncbi:retrovirus-related pol polyprotein from transposon TNT 1-94 [Tanacetum coccineum]